MFFQTRASKAEDLLAKRLVELLAKLGRVAERVDCIKKERDQARAERDALTTEVEELNELLSTQGRNYKKARAGLKRFEAMAQLEAMPKFPGSVIVAGSVYAAPEKCHSCFGSGVIENHDGTATACGLCRPLRELGRNP